MHWKTRLYQHLSKNVWGALPASAQKTISSSYTNAYNQPWSKWLIEPYCKINYDDPKYLEQFEPASGGEDYQHFQDFFTRRFRTAPSIETQSAWPCEGFLCDYGRIDQLNLVKVKGQERHLRVIFGDAGPTIPDKYYFTNIFLHNKNYHRIHAPVDGVVSRIEVVPGELVLLRPWIYPQHPSYPALVNERVNVDLMDFNGDTWYLSIVGGPAVGTIQMADGIGIGTHLKVGEEFATFLLGSTCCMAAPRPIYRSKVGDWVEMGNPL